MLLGAALGSGYKLIGESIFESGREAWINYRTDRIITSPERVVSPTRTRFISLQQAQRDTASAQELSKKIDYFRNNTGEATQNPSSAPSNKT